MVLVFTLASLLPKHSGAIEIRTYGIRQCGWYDSIPKEEINLHYNRLKDLIEATSTQLALIVPQTPLIQAVRTAVGKILIHLYFIEGWVDLINNDIHPTPYNAQEPAIITLTGRLLEELEEPIPEISAFSPSENILVLYSDIQLLQHLPHPLGSVF